MFCCGLEGPAVAFGAGGLALTDKIPRAFASPITRCCMAVSIQSIGIRATVRTLSSRVKEGKSLFPNPASCFNSGSLLVSILNNSALMLDSCSCRISGPPPTCICRISGPRGGWRAAIEGLGCGMPCEAGELGWLAGFASCGNVPGGICGVPAMCAPGMPGWPFGGGIGPRFIGC